MLNQGCPSWGWNARRQATHCVAPQRKPSTTALTARTWPQRILVAFMATKDQEATGDSPQVGNAGEREAGGFDACPSTDIRADNLRKARKQVGGELANRIAIAAQHLTKGAANHRVSKGAENYRQQN